MRKLLLVPLLAAVWVSGAEPATPAQPAAPQFNAKGELLFPSDYREWVYLSSGLGMTYGPAAAMAADNPMFDNVYVNPPAFAAFKQTGQWPEGTIFVLEIRFSTSHGSINNGGFYQTDVAAIESAVKDTKRFPRGWGYFNFRGGLRPTVDSATVLGDNAGCQACHSANGAVEQTFSQFYPTALAIAEKKGTVRASYKPPAASPAKLYELIRAKAHTPDELLQQAKATDPTAGVLKENTLNQIGYSLLQDGDKDQALAVFQWNTVAFPQSANAFDSLAEACETAGLTPRARAASTRALELLPTDSTLSPRRRDLIQQASTDRLTRLPQ